MGDIDHDGHVDLVVAAPFSVSGTVQNVRPVVVYFGEGDGLFGPGVVPAVLPKKPATTCVALGDVNGDKFLDIFVGNASAPSQLLLTAKNRTWKLATSLPTPRRGSVYGGAFVDIDGDKRLDLLVGHDGASALSALSIYMNRSGGFVDETALRLSSGLRARRALVHRFSFGDVDGDGDIDILESHGDLPVQGGGFALLINNGKGAFTDGTAASGLPTGATAGWTHIALLADFSGSGSPDVFLGSSLPGPAPQIYANNGRGRFTRVTGALTATKMTISDAAATDFDGDGDLDLAVVHFGHRCLDPKRFYTGWNEVWRNSGDWSQGKGSLTQAVRFEVEDSRAVVAGDVDADGDADLVIGGLSTSDRLYLNASTKQSMAFVSGHRELPTNTDRSAVVTSGDFNKDGFEDLVFGHTSTIITQGQNLEHCSSLSVVLNKAAGLRRSVTHPPVFRNAANLGPAVFSLATADVDADGNLDLCVGTATGYDSFMLWGNGKGGFSLSPKPDFPTHPLHQNAGAIVPLDADGDGDMDVFVGTGINKRALNYLFIQTGVGTRTFRQATVSEFPAGAQPAWGAAALDLNGDGKQDLVVCASSPAGMGVFINASTKTQIRFVNRAAAYLPVQQPSARRIVVADFNNDKLDDFCVIPYGGPAKVYLRVKGQTLMKFVALPGTTPAISVAAGDVNEDGNVDLVFGVDTRNAWPSRVQDANELWLGDGKGAFTFARGDLPADWTVTNGIALVDVDSDGDLDVVEANGGEAMFAHGAQNRVRFNLNRQLSSRKIARPGRLIALEAWYRPGGKNPPSTTVSLWIPWLGLTRLNPGKDTAFGTWRVGFPILQLPAAVFPTTTTGNRRAGRSRVGLPLPNDPRFIGAKLYFQGTIISQDALKRWILEFTNMEVVEPLSV